MQRRGYSPASAEVAVRRLLSLNYLNDEVFARNWALSRAQTQSYGPRRIEQELLGKGIAPSLIRAAVRATFDQVDETSQASRLLTRRFKGEKLNETQIARRAAAFLQRRGFSSKVIFDLLRCSVEEE